MTICRLLCTKNGGDITVTSAGEGQGSTFVFSMKMELVESREGEDHNSEVDVDTQDFKSDSADSLEREDTQVFECH